jgi:hypothetical protein
VTSGFCVSCVEPTGFTNSYTRNFFIGKVTYSLIKEECSVGLEDI